MWRVRLFFAYVLALIVTVVLSITGIVFAIPIIRGRHRAVTHWCIKRWAIILCTLFGIHVSYKQLFDYSLNKNQSFVFVSNHLSALDIIVLLSVLPVRSVWVTKREVFFYPFLGWVIKCAGFISVKRDGNRAAIKKQFSDIQKRLERMQCSVLFFPEGTRSRSGGLGEFKTGAFRTATTTGFPVVPVVLYGTHELMNKDNPLVVRPGTVTVTMSRPIWGRGVSPRQLAYDTRNIMLSIFEAQVRTHRTVDLTIKKGLLS